MAIRTPFGQHVVNVLMNVGGALVPTAVGFCLILSLGSAGLRHPLLAVVGAVATYFLVYFVARIFGDLNRTNAFLCSVGGVLLLLVAYFLLWAPWVLSPVGHVLMGGLGIAVLVLGSLELFDDGRIDVRGIVEGKYD